jgi:hypothetical protein
MNKRLLYFLLSILCLLIGVGLYYFFKKDVLVERLHMKGDQIDIKVIYVYKDGVLLRREWWQRGKRISYTLE